MTLVRGSTDRLKLEWDRDRGTAPDGRVYMLDSENVRGEGRVYWFDVPREIERVFSTADVPYGYEGTLHDARKQAEWVAWIDAGRPTE